jgi:light-harvesting complex II chlorophyll a/b binding protein 4
VFKAAFGTMAAIASLQVNALFGKKAPAKAAPAKKATLKKAAPVKKSAPVKKTVTKKAPARKAAGAGRKGNIGPNRTLWNGWDSKAEAPAYLDGTLPGDAGFDPAGLSKPVEYLQFGLDSLDQNGVINASGNVIGKLKKVDNKPTERTIVPFNEAFDIVRFRECELQHSRWAMLGLVGVIAAEKSTGISWADAGKVLNEQPSYLGFDINVPLKSLVLIEVLAMGFAEVKRSSELDSNKRSYPGGYFDPLNFAGKTTSPEALFKLKTAELKHGRLAMVGMLGVAAQATKNGEGALEALFGQ